jgi:hypothetical protein
MWLKHAAAWALAAAMCGAGVHAAVAVPSIFSDGAVLQDYYRYDSRSFVWGTASPGEAVVLNVTTDITHDLTLYNMVADDSGDWRVQLNPDYFVIEQPQTVTITISGSSDGHQRVITIRDVSYGDVFLW